MAACIDQPQSLTPPEQKSSSVTEEKQVIGPDGQVCASQDVLDRILQVYNHISANLFHRGTNGKIAGEVMMCECRYEAGNRVLSRN